MKDTYLLKLLIEFPFHLIKREADQGKPRPPWEPWEESGEVYYPGTEIDGYMPRRGDFAHVSEGGRELMVRSEWCVVRKG